MKASKEIVEQPIIHRLIIDVYTKSIRSVINRLKVLKSTISVQDGGQYCHCSDYSQVWIETIKSLEEMEDWLYKTKGVDYIGVVEDKEEVQNENI